MLVLSFVYIETNQAIHSSYPNNHTLCAVLQVMCAHRNCFLLDPGTAGVELCGSVLAGENGLVADWCSLVSALLFDTSETNLDNYNR